MARSPRENKGANLTYHSPGRGNRISRTAGQNRQSQGTGTRSPALLAGLVLVLVLGLFSAVNPGNAADRPEAVNLVQNPGLEEGADLPHCFSRSGWGSEGAWAVAAGRGGGRAASVSIAEYVSGDRKLLQTESPDCAPAVTAGTGYEMEIWYQSDVPVTLTAFVHGPSGWSYWGDLQTFPASSGWSAARKQTPVVPPGTTMMSFGLALAGSGTLTTDDYSLRAAAPPQETGPAGVLNPNLSAGSGPLPECFLSAGWGENTVSGSLTDDVPAGSAPGTRAFELVMSNHISGDAKLIPSEAPGCAPSVTGNGPWDLSIDYLSTTASASFTVFVHTPAGWQYWTDLADLPAAPGWATAKARLEKVPAGTDRVSFGIALFGTGTLKTTNYALLPAPPDPLPEPVDPGQPELTGSWEVLESELPIRAVHTTLLHDGRLLLIAGSGNDGNLFAAGEFRAVLWDAATGEFTDVPVPYDMFCAGHVTLPDGKVLLAGGTQEYPGAQDGPTTFEGSKQSYYFDPADDSFHRLPDMAGAHWYPSLTKLGSGDVWSAGGLDEKAEGTVLTEMFDYSSMSWLPQAAVPQTWSFWGTYPHMFLLDDGTMFYTGGHTFGNGLPGTGASIYNWQTARMWDVPGLRQKDLRDQAGSVFIGPVQDQRLMIVGGGNTETNEPAISLVDIVDLNSPTPSYSPGPDLPGPGKAYVNLVNLPDRTVLASNGARHNRASDVLTAALYDPADNQWQSVPADPVARNYHSTAILLPDGRVAVLGSNPLDNSFEFRISVYSPPYMAADRPRILEAPKRAGYGESFTVQVDGEATAASLMSPMSATHQTDTNARLIDLPISETGNTYTVQVPENRNLVPPGPYMFTVLDGAGVPSTARWVWIS